MKQIIYFITSATFLFLSATMNGQENINRNKFKQLGTELPTPNEYRNASGAPGHKYWQQRADYKISITLDDENQRIDGSEVVTYHNNSPDLLSYLWIQLDQNRRAKDSDGKLISTGGLNDRMSTDRLASYLNTFDGGFKILSVTDQNDNPLDYIINKTMMRITPSAPIEPGGQYQFKISYWYNINDRMAIGGRSGYEYFEADDNYLYTIAQFFPRMCAYNDIEGWQNKQFLGRGEFTLIFGNYEVDITVPSDHLVAATGQLINEKQVLSREQINRLKKARNNFDQPVIIATQEEAVQREQSRSQNFKTWRFRAENVRDFAFASSRKFIWDAMAVKQEDGSITMAMSMYPKEGNPLWEKYSTKVVAHTLKWFSHYSFPYPYPVAWSINAASIGMEYPMICFNYGRCEKDGTYSRRTKYGMISVIIHEVGHNYFPMIVNSDERQWTWMDEGLTTFLQYLTEQQWERNYPSRRGPAYKITDYMKGNKDYISPIMTNSESIWQFGSNAYAKPATALNILRETVMGRELFDMAFKEYCNRWMFKQPYPADFFRTMEDASGVDLDWFWRGWFYTTDHVDVSLDRVRWYKFDDGNPDIKNEIATKQEDLRDNYISNIRNKESIASTVTESDPSTIDFYTLNAPNRITVEDKEAYDNFLNSLNESEAAALKTYKNFYEITFKNVGGLISPIILKFEYNDGTHDIIRIPAEIWRRQNERVTKVFPSEKEINRIVLDPFLETADTDVSNNVFPQESSYDRFDVFKRKQSRNRENEMQRDRRLNNKDDKEDRP